MTRVGASLLIALCVTVGTLGCQSLPTPTPTPSDGAAIDGDQPVPGGETAVGALGDPCLLLTKREIEDALGVPVIGVTRGALDADGTQLCAWALDAPGSTAAALGGFVGTIPGGEVGTLVDGLGTAGAVFGVILAPVDPSDIGSDSGDDSDPAPAEPGVTIVKVDLGSGGAVIALPNGGAAFASDGTQTTLTLMDLIAGPSSADTLESLLTTAYNRL